MQLYKNKIILLLAFFLSSAYCAERADIIVAQDGSGNFTTIQAALDSIPTRTDRYWIILIKNGEYKEKLFISKSRICLVGEDRENTKIIYPELRKNWRAEHSDDWGAAVINIGNEVTDIVLANLTIYNNYGSLYGDNDHQFAIRSGGNSNRIIIVNCNVWADGGDTVSLWNSNSGMYYHANCYFNGWVDYVCPRGWCYITDSKFYGFNKSASIWHDGKSDSTMKFVIRNSTFDGINNFPLGRFHHDAQFYLLDCRFSENMKDQPIYPVNELSKYKWGIRTYFWNCHRDGGDYLWHSDNLNSAYEGSIDQSEISAYWTFAGRWDPEHTMPAVLPFASIPYPRNGAYSLSSKNVDTLRWIGGRNAVSYNLYFDINNPPKFVQNQKENFHILKNLKPDQNYYWRVDVVTEKDTIKGDLWTFKTKSNEQ
ncbi:MAG: rhamnogalacturonan acetylesterase [Ignavibacteriae bacterium]|nr:MAG: rhamnogalacturonan acetylesterase [Ignavibacteriota bacterium]